MNRKLGEKYMWRTDDGKKHSLIVSLNWNFG